MSSFAYFFVVFAFFIVSFGLGFYIIFNGRKDKFGTKTTGKEVEDKGDTNYFAFPFLAVIKTSAMMVGELVRKQQIFDMICTMKYVVNTLIVIKFCIY